MECFIFRFLCLKHKDLNKFSKNFSLKELQDKHFEFPTNEIIGKLTNSLDAF